MALNLSALTAGPDKAKKASAIVKPSGSEMAQVLAAVRKEKGEKTVVSARSMPPIRRLPTGIFEFDYYTGGGFPRGGYSIVYGPESSCKSGLAMAAVAQCQNFDPAPNNKAVWVALEPFSPVWAEKWGVDIDNLQVIQPSYGEEAVDLVDAFMRAEDVGVLVVDSTAALVPSKEIGQSTEKFDVGTASLLTKRLCNKMMVAFGEERKRGHEPTVILINQTRFKIGVMFGDPETMPGGECQKFLAMLRVRTYGTNVTDKVLNQYVSKNVHCVVKKSKVPVRGVSWDMELTMVEHDGLRIGQSDSFNSVKSQLQALDKITKVSKGYVVEDYNDTCHLCDGSGKDSSAKQCGLCKGTGALPHVFATISDMSDLYRINAGFSGLLQGYVLDANQGGFVVDEKIEAPKDVAPGDVCPMEGVA